jgi:hypothetical protein
VNLHPDPSSPSLEASPSPYPSTIVTARPHHALDQVRLPPFFLQFRSNSSSKFHTWRDPRRGRRFDGRGGVWVALPWSAGRGRRRLGMGGAGMAGRPSRPGRAVRTSWGLGHVQIDAIPTTLILTSPPICAQICQLREHKRAHVYSFFSWKRNNERYQFCGVLSARATDCNFLLLSNCCPIDWEIEWSWLQFRQFCYCLCWINCTLFFFFVYVPVLLILHWIEL